MRMIHPTKLTVKSISNEIYRKQPSADYVKSSVSKVVSTFCAESSLHGQRHIGGKDRNPGERLFWAGAFVVSIVAAGLLISDIWNEYKDMPIETVFTAKVISIDEIPFPSITICNTNSIRKSFYESQKRNLSKIFAKPAYDYAKDPDTLKVFAALGDIYHICDTSATFVSHFVNSRSLDAMENLTQTFRQYNEFYRPYNRRKKTLVTGAQPCAELILRCVWEGVAVECGDVIEDVITDFGYCCTFNSLPVTLLERKSTKPRYEHDLEDWKAANLTASNLIASGESIQRKVPRAQKYSGRSGGLSFLLHSDLNQYVCSSTNSKGFVLGANSPIDYPKLRETGIAIPIGEETFIGIQPQITMTEDSLSSFSTRDRQCYYGNEHQLEFFTKYTVSNCISECIARKTMERCGCVRYYMPRNRSANQTVCNRDKFNCPTLVQRNITRTGKYKECNECLPTCTDIKYIKEVTSLKLQEEDVRDLFSSDGETKYLNDTNQMSIVHVYFNEDAAQPRIRKQVTSTVKLLSSAGGLLGLCMGFSVLSLLEIAYFFIVRLYMQLVEDKREKVASSLEKGFATQSMKDKAGVGWAG